MSNLQTGNRVIITVIGTDQVGIIAWISGLLAEQNANILDITQTVLQEFFTMIMVVDLADAKVDFKQLRDTLAADGEKRSLKVSMQHEDVFQFMHRI